MQATTAQISHARDTFVLRVAIHKWRSALVRRRERMAQADARAGSHLQKAALVRWQLHLQERRKAAWRADMRVRMQTVRSLRDGALRRDAWARWRQLYQSRLMQQRFAVLLVERCFERSEERGARGRRESWSARGWGVYGVLASSSVRTVIFPGFGMLC